MGLVERLTASGMGADLPSKANIREYSTGRALPQLVLCASTAGVTLASHSLAAVPTALPAGDEESSFTPGKDDVLEIAGTDLSTPSVYPPPSLSSPLGLNSAHNPQLSVSLTY